MCEDATTPDRYERLNFPALSRPIRKKTICHVFRAMRAYGQIRRLCFGKQSRSSVRRVGQFQIFSVLSIGHTTLPGFQRILSFPFSVKRYRTTNRQDLVFVRPPDAGKDFRVSINTVWYCRVLLLFSFYTSTDSGIKRHDCAFVSLLWEYDAAPSGTK